MSKLSIFWTEFNTFFKTHERLLLVGVALLLGYWGWGKYLDHESQVKKQEAVQSQQVLQAQIEQNKEYAAQAQAAYQSTQQLYQQMLQQGEALTLAIAARNQQVVVQQKSDAALPPAELGKRWESLIGTSGQVQPTASGYEVSPVAAVVTTQTLEEVPVLKKNNSDLSDQVASQKQVIDSGKDLVQKQQTEIDGLGLQLKDKDKQCSEQVASVKADARKKVRKAFGWGAALGFVAQAVIKVFTGF